MPFGLLLLLYYNFGQRTSIQLPSALPLNVFTPPSSGHLPVTHYVNYLKMFYLDAFVIALNAVFTQQLSLADEGHESSSDTVDLPTPLRKTPCIHHVSSTEHVSFNPVHTAPCNTVTITPQSPPQTPTRLVCCHLSFSSDGDQDPDSIPVYADSSDDDRDPDSTPVYSDSPDEEEEDFPMVPLDDKHWTLETVPERPFCIHENGLPNNLCQHPCPYGSNDTVSYIDSLGVSDISYYEDYMVTSSDEEQQGMEGIPY